MYPHHDGNVDVNKFMDGTLPVYHSQWVHLMFSYLYKRLTKLYHLHNLLCFVHYGEDVH